MTVGLQVFDANGKETVNSNQTLLNVVQTGYMPGAGIVYIPPGLNNPMIAISPEGIGTGAAREYRYAYYNGDMVSSFELARTAAPFNNTSSAPALPYSYAILSQETSPDSHGLRVVNQDGTIWDASRKLFQIDAITYRYANNWFVNPAEVVSLPQSRPGKLWLILNTMGYVFTNYVGTQPDVRLAVACWRLSNGVIQVGTNQAGNLGTCDLDSNGSYISIISGFIE